MDQFTRRIVGFGVQAAVVDGVALCRMFNQAISQMGTPAYLSSDHDPLFKYHQWGTNLRILEVDEVKSIPYTPRSHPFIERLIGPVRREFLDQTLFWNVTDLARKLTDFPVYYNHHRTHSIPRRQHTGRSCRRNHKVTRFAERLSLADTLPRALSTAPGGLSSNSPGTGYRDLMSRNAAMTPGPIDERFEMLKPSQ